VLANLGAPNRDPRHMVDRLTVAVHLWQKAARKERYDRVDGAQSRPQRILNYRGGTDWCGSALSRSRAVFVVLWSRCSEIKC
jgi:hypothetical protein